MPKGTLLLDFIRYHRQLKGTKIGCREGDCGACMVLVGSVKDGGLHYRSFTSCLTPLGNVQGKHVVTIEGINTQGLTPVQQAMCNASATQCGFCTPGFVVSLTGFCVSRQQPSCSNAIASADGNICRCTGYKSIERAAGQVAQIMQQKGSEDPVAFAIRNQLLPPWFGTIKERLQRLPEQVQQNGAAQPAIARLVGGGTDLYVQQPENLKHAAIRFLHNHPQWNTITGKNGRCITGPSATVTDISESPVMQASFPALNRYIKLISSTPVRNMATVAGNFINASPIGDLTIFFLALDATLQLNDGSSSRELPLRSLYKGYKLLDKTPEECIEQISFSLPGPDTRFNFEKVSKRTNLDIASVNTAISITVVNDIITNVHLSAGGVGPVPLYLEKTALFLQGKRVDVATVSQAAAVAQTEISPISDARGSHEYKRLLLNQLIKAHFITLFPQLQLD